MRGSYDAAVRSGLQARTRSLEGAGTRPATRTLVLIMAVVGLVYLAVVGLRIRHYGYNVSALIDAGQKVVRHEPGALGHHVIVFRDSGGYDGLAYYSVAADPFLQHPVIRDPFRYQRIGYPLLIWAASLGQRAWRPVAMVAVNLVAVMLVALLSALIIAAYGGKASPWWALAGAINPSLIIGVEYDLAEPLLMACCLLGLFLYLRRRVGWAALAFAAAMLMREVAILFILPVLIAEVVARRPLRAALMLLSVAPYLIWQAILAAAFGRVGLGTSRGNLDLPLAGIGAVIAEARHGSLRSALVHQGSIALVIVLVIVAIIISAVQLWRRPDVVVGSILVHGLAALLGGAAIWETYASAARVFGGIYPLGIFASTRYRTVSFALIGTLSIVITLLTFVRLVLILPVQPYYVTP